MLELYTKMSLSQYSIPLEINTNDLVFNLGSIVNPKMMLKLMSDNQDAKREIFKTFNYLYKFSL